MNWQRCLVSLTNISGVLDTQFAQIRRGPPTSPSTDQTKPRDGSISSRKSTLLFPPAFNDYKLTLKHCPRYQKLTNVMKLFTRLDNHYGSDFEKWQIRKHLNYQSTAVSGPGWVTVGDG